MLHDECAARARERRARIGAAGGDTLCMATWAVGDVQGCAASLAALLDAISFDPAADVLWFVGDLVNRGPDSAGVLRLVRGLGARAVAVLGNHDLHLLARAAGVTRPSRRDTVEDVLDAPDRDELLTWLAARPLLHEGEGHVLVHAGLLPAWALDDAREAARAAERVLAGPSRAHFLEAYRRGHAKGSLAGVVRGARALTTIRFVDRAGRPVEGASGPPDDARPGETPWFRARRPAPHEPPVVFGHWAALGLLSEPGLLALDTGCVWGGTLTAARLEDRRIVSVPHRDSRAVRGSRAGFTGAS